MKWLNRLKSKAALDRISEEILYEAAYKEVDSGARRAGLWAKALAKANGSEERARSLYIEFLVQKYKDESHLEDEVRREAHEEYRRQQRHAHAEAEAREQKQSEAAYRQSTTEREVSSTDANKPHEDNEMWKPAISGDTVLLLFIALIGAVMFVAIIFAW